MTLPWNIKRVLEWATDDLRKRGSESPRLEAELMLAMVLDCDRIRLIIDSERPLETGELNAYKAFHKRRRGGEPIAYLRGEREFFSRSYLVDSRVLVPRPETEILVEVGLRRTRHLDLSARVLDLCTGSGCVAITLKKERPTTQVIGSDISAEALEVAKLNALRLGALVGWTASDVFAELNALRQSLDLVVANPPYITTEDMEELPVDVRSFEPRMALEAGDDGLGIIRRIVAEAPSMLAPGGVLALEVGAGQAPAVRELLDKAKLEAIETDRDYGGHERIVSARRSTSNTIR